MGLSHITVVDKDNQVVGILSRKDLTNINIHRRLERKLRDEREADAAAAHDTRDEERGTGGMGGGGGGMAASSRGGVAAAAAAAAEQDEQQQPRSVGGVSRSTTTRAHKADVQLQGSHSDAIAVAGLNQGVLF